MKYVLFMDIMKCLFGQLFVGFKKFRCELVSREDRQKPAMSAKMGARVKEIFAMMQDTPLGK